MSEHAKPMTARRATVSSASEGQTEGVGRRLAAELPPGTAIALTGPLGAGKTVFARGVASGLGVNPVDVASPTFVYLVDYSEGRIPFIHADLYRFADVPPEMAELAFESIGLDAALASDAVTLVEWWPYYARAHGAEPERLVSVELVVESGDVRSIHLDFRGPGLDAAWRRFSG
ncbi:MAG TPA: tRNA (adenosine(37)-N6)-threonylcarbamoyltransferase complex ATPase subunit type 1 TsaE [Candidatus Limnocylindrales bacterium]|nr:tRNA (adenosine(37)-N6)-threonylcarbamoyltransferase complex ATPase subunit type 1 TsaE [Candidatus Limnocylindrales bacterium]